VPAGARLVMEAPGSGGYGPPSARDHALVREDRADGYVTRDGEGPLNNDGEGSLNSGSRG
jgi:N-methylhydantoinase B/oxoprolinase/acetone carboxylase alpha subunit